MNPFAVLIAVVLIIFFFIDPCMVMSIILLGSLAYGFVNSKQS